MTGITVTGTAHANCVMMDYCEILIPAINVNAPFEVHFPAAAAHLGHEVKLMETTYEDNYIKGKIEHDVQVELFHYFFQLSAANPSMHWPITPTMTIVGNPQEQPVPVDVRFYEPRPQITTNIWGSAHACFDSANHENCPITLEGWGFTKTMEIEAELFYNGRHVPVDLGGEPAIDNSQNEFTISPDPGAPSETHMVVTKFNPRALEFIDSHCGILKLKFKAKNKSRGRGLGSTEFTIDLREFNPLCKQEQCQVVNFDEQQFTGALLFDDVHYKGFYLDNVGVIETSKWGLNSGYYKAAGSHHYASYNGWAQPSTFSRNQAFSLHQLSLGAAWADNNQVTFLAWDEEGNLTGNRTATANTYEPITVVFDDGFKNIFEIEVSSNNWHYVIDDIEVCIANGDSFTEARRRRGENVDPNNSNLEDGEDASGNPQA
eukprot:Pgem_evm1s18378